jgi:hypothetical protein
MIDHIFDSLDEAFAFWFVFVIVTILCGVFLVFSLPHLSTNPSIGLINVVPFMVLAIIFYLAGNSLRAAQNLPKLLQADNSWALATTLRVLKMKCARIPFVGPLFLFGLYRKELAAANLRLLELRVNEVEDAISEIRIAEKPLAIRQTLLSIVDILELVTKSNRGPGLENELSLDKRFSNMFYALERDLAWLEDVLRSEKSLLEELLESDVYQRNKNEEAKEQIKEKLTTLLQGLHINLQEIAVHHNDVQNIIDYCGRHGWGIHSLFEAMPWK